MKDIINVVDAKTKALMDGLRSAAFSEPQGQILAVWSALVNGEMSLLDFANWARERDKLNFLTIDTTGACDLICKGMCYYHPDINLHNPFVSEETLKQAIKDAIDHLNLKTLIFAGKEPFLNPGRLFNLLDFAGPKEKRNFQTGIVTNGRRIHRFWSDIETLVNRKRLDFIDISIDSGFAEQHDQIRGVKGTFDLAIATTQQFAEVFPEVRLTITSILRSDNETGILELMRLVSKQVKNFQIQPIQPPPFSDTKPLSADFVVGFLQKLHRTLNQSEINEKVEVSVAVLGIYLMEVANAGFFSWHELREDVNGTVYFERDVNGHLLIITCDVFSLQAWRLARITYDGAYLAHMHFLQTPDRKPYLVGYIQNEPISSLFKKALASGSHFQKIVESRLNHDCCKRPCWKNCFGGWNGTENSFLTDQPLTQQPRLCIKTEDDFVRLSS